MRTVSQTRRLQTLVIYCMIQRFSEEESLAYLKSENFIITDRSLYRLKAKIKKNEFHRLSEIAKSGFVSQHLERIDQLELISKEMWSQYYKEPDAYKKVMILSTIAQIQPYLSQYYESSKNIMEASTKDEIRDKNTANSLSRVSE